MAERELFQIGEVAKMYHLSVGTLRHYEQVGLLKPEYTDPATGYRYYSVRQFEQLTNIRYLRALGLPLDEIAATLHDRDVIAVTEAVVARAQGNYASVDDIAADVKEKLEKAGLHVFTIEQLQKRAEKLVGVPDPIRYKDRIVGVVMYRDNTIIDVIRQIDEDA